MRSTWYKAMHARRERSEGHPGVDEVDAMDLMCVGDDGLSKRYDVGWDLWEV